MRRLGPLGAIGALALGSGMATGCASTPPPEDPVDVDVASSATPASTATGDAGSVRRKRPHTEVPPSATFPEGLVVAVEPPLEMRSQKADSALPASRSEAEALGAQLVTEVLAQQTKLVASGPTVVMRFGTGDQMSLLSRFEPGRCYAAYATSSGEIAEVDLQFTVDFSAIAPPGSGSVLPATLPPMTLAMDSDIGPTAGIGIKGGNCMKTPLPMGVPVVVHVASKAGAGLIAVQLFAEGVGPPSTPTP
jgi:hypothetical protein